MSHLKESFHATSKYLILLPMVKASELSKNNLCQENHSITKSLILVNDRFFPDFSARLISLSLKEVSRGLLDLFILQIESSPHKRLLVSRNKELS